MYISLSLYIYIYTYILYYVIHIYMIFGSSGTARGAPSVGSEASVAREAARCLARNMILHNMKA